MIAPPAGLASDDRRLAALVATFAPDSAARILARFSGGEPAATWGAALAGLSRRGRLEALARALASSVDAPAAAAARTLLDAERPGVARALGPLALERAPWPGAAHPLLARAVRERLSAVSPGSREPAGA